MSNLFQSLRVWLAAAVAASLFVPAASLAAKKETLLEAPAAEAPPAAPGSQIPWKTPTYTLVANDMDLRSALDTFAVAEGLSAVMSRDVSGMFSGTFQEVSPAEFLDRIATVHNLVWYYDGAALYFYGAGEIQTLLLDLQYMKAGEVRQMLAELGVEDQRFPLKTTSNDELIMVSGPPRYVGLIAELVAKADKLRELRTFNEVEARLFPLVHTWADDVSFGASSPESSGSIRGVASLLNEIMSADEDMHAHVRDSTDETQTALTPVEAAMLAGFKPVIKAEPRLNAVIVRDVISRMPIYERLIRQLDVPQRLVEIEVTVVELSKSDALDWQLSLAGSHSPSDSTSWGAGQNAGNLFAQEDIAGQGLAGAVTYLGDKFTVNASLTALKSKNKARSISRTSLLTVNNLAAEMSDSQSYHARVVGSEVATLQEVSAGTTLQIKPRILPTGRRNVGNQVWLSLRLDDGGFQSVTVDSMPMTRSSALVTQTSVFEDESIMLAGYLRDIEEKAGWGIPLLRDIPLLGWLFGGHSTKKETVQRMFIISPHVIDLDLEAVGREQAARMRDITDVEAIQDDADHDAIERERRDLERDELRRRRDENAKDDLKRRRAELKHQREIRDIEREGREDELDEDIREWRDEEQELRREAKEEKKTRKRRSSRKSKRLSSEESAAVRVLESAMGSHDQQGLETAETLAAQFPESAPVQLAAGSVWEDAGNMDAAMESYSRALVLEPENPEALWVMARAAGAAGRDDLKEDALLQLLRLQPNNPDALWALAGMATGQEGTLYRAFGVRYPDDPRAKEAASRGAASEDKDSESTEETTTGDSEN